MLPQPGVPITINDPAKIDQLNQLSTSVYECVEKLVSALDARASWLLNSEQLNAALNDANVMIGIAPSSPLGYLNAGSIYVMAKQHKSAIDIYDKGLHHVPKTDPRYHQLIEAKANADNKRDKRVDFISKLPLDVVMCNIIPRILCGQTEIVIGMDHEYLKVCRAWQQRIAMMDDLMFRVGPWPVPCHQHLLDMAPCIKSLNVVENDQDIFTKLPEGARFHSLKQLNVFCKESTKVCVWRRARLIDFLDLTSARPSPPLLLDLLSSLRSLTHLTIDCVFGLHKCRLSHILDACTNLVAISVAYLDYDMSEASKAYSNITKLEIKSYVSDVKIAGLLQQLPNLQCLQLQCISDNNAQVLSVIQQHGSHLQDLFLSNKRFYRPESICEGQTKGLRALHTSCERSYATISERRIHANNMRQLFTEDDMVRFIMRHCETLEMITIDTPRAFAPPKRLLKKDSTQRITFSRLRTLRFPSDSQKHLVPFLMWIIRRAPHLESVDTVHGAIKEPLMHELLSPTRPQYLKKIGLVADRSTHVYEEQFIQHHIRLGHHSNLKEITVTISPWTLSNPWILLIGQLTQLTHLEVCYKGYDVVDGSVSPFIAEIASRCSCLERFTFTATPCKVDYKDFSGIAPHSNLKTLVIKASELRGDALSFARRHDSLHSLHVTLFKFNWVDMDVLLDKGTFQLVCTQKRYMSVFM